MRMDRFLETLAVMVLTFLFGIVVFYAGWEYGETTQALQTTPTITREPQTEPSATPTITLSPTPTEEPICPTDVPQIMSVDISDEDEVAFLSLRDGVAYEQIVTIRYKMVSYCLGLVKGEWVLIEYCFG